MEYYSTIKNNEIWPYTMQMDLEDIRLSEMSDRERQTPCSSTYMWHLKNKTNEQTKAETDS